MGYVEPDEDPFASSSGTEDSDCEDVEDVGESNDPFASGSEDPDSD